jgi:transposase
MKTGHYLGHYHWVGADVAKNTFDAALVLAHQHFPATQLRDIPVRTFPRSEKGVSDFIQWLDTFELSDASVRVMMESTGSFSTELCAWMLKQRDSLSPAIETARYTAHYLKSMGLRNKTDRLEARALGFYGIERNPRPYTKPAPEYLELPQLSRYRDNLVHQQTRLKNQTHETTTAFIKHEQQKQLTRLKKDITRVEKAMKDLIKKHDKLAHDIDLLTTIYGIAFISAVTLVAELGDLRRFDKARLLTALSGSPHASTKAEPAFTAKAESVSKATPAYAKFSTSAPWSPSSPSCANYSSSCAPSSSPENPTKPMGITR